MSDKVSKLYYRLLEIYVNEFHRLEKTNKKKVAIKNKSKPRGLFLEDDKTLKDDKIDDIPPDNHLKVLKKNLLRCNPLHC